jgi:iron(III) transport system ATP-binding protein
VSLELRGLTKVFPDPLDPAREVRAVDDLSLVLREGELVTLLGPSGCGKTTALRMVAGFETPTAGSIRIGGVDVTRRPPHRRDTAMVFQSYAIFPHLTVAENVGFGLRTRGVPPPEIARRVAALLDLVQLEGLGDRSPDRVSGGQQQRVALARAIITEPKVLLFDEPLSNLDAKLRAEMRGEIRAIQRRVGITSLYVTHDQAEAMALADRIAVMEAGRVVQVAPPATLFREPATAMVAGFVGRGTVVPGVVLEAEREGACAVEVLGARARLRARPGHPAGPAAICLRPEDLRPARPGEPALAGTVRRTLYLGGRTAVELELRGTPDARLTLTVPPADAPAPGTALALALDDGWILPA